MTFTTPPDDRLSGPVHGYFGLTYANYEVTPRTLAQSMPPEWQQRWVACQRELREAFAHIEQPEAYEVRPAVESTYDELTREQRLELGIDYDSESQLSAAFYDHRDGQEHEGRERVLVPVGLDPVPHYDRGRKFVEPRLPEPVPGVARYRVKHAEVDALQWTGSNVAEMEAFAGADFSHAPEAGDDAAEILTARHSSWETVYPGRWVLRGPAGLFIVEADRFVEGYEPIAAVDDPDPEPRFVVRGKDKLAAATVAGYYRQCVAIGLDEQAKQVMLALDEVEAWQKRHPDLVKLPDHQHVPATPASGRPDGLELVTVEPGVYEQGDDEPRGASS